jgi:hypothetical protein
MTSVSRANIHRETGKPKLVDLKGYFNRKGCSSASGIDPASDRQSFESYSSLCELRGISGL